MDRLYSIAFALLVAVARLAAAFSPKLKAFFEGRNGQIERVSAWRETVEQDPFWFHCSSSGELEQLIPVLESLREMDGQVKCFLTVFSPSGWRAVQLETERRKIWNLPLPWDGADWSPLDFSYGVNAFLDALRPRAFFSIHRELWPTLSRELAQRRVPQAVLAAYFRERDSRRLRFPLASPWRNTWRRLSWVGTIDDASAHRLHMFFPKLSVMTLGDPRKERVLQRQRRNPAKAKHADLRTLVLASVWKADVELSLPGVAAMRNAFPEWQVVWVPHEPTDKFCTWLDDKFRHTVPSSKIQWLREGNPNTSSAVWGIARIGGLAELYASADLVYVGGSAGGRVHNVLEPAAYGLPILTGPRISNSREAQELSPQALTACKDAAAFQTALVELLESEILRFEQGRAARAYLESGIGISATYASKILQSF